MVVESDGTVHIVGKYGSSFVEFHYTTNKSGSWVSREIANISSHVLHTYDALAVDSQGDMHYFFRNASTFYSGVLFHLVESGVSTVGSGSSSAPAFAYANNQVAGAMQHTCAILANGDLKCWGYDNSGQLGDGGTAANTAAPSTTAIDLGMGRTAVAVSAGDTHTCAILDNDDLKCWGAGPKGQLGMGNTVNLNAPPSTAIDLGTGRTAVAVAAGADHTCAVLDNGELKCWGGGYYGQLGDGISTDSNEPSTTAIDLGTGRTAVAVSAGEYFTCAILDNGNVTCWGRDNHGQLGDGGTNLDTNEPSTTAIDLGTGRTAVALSSGSYHTCAILDNGDLKCWGYNGFGELGDGSTSSLNAPSPTAIDLGTSRTAVAMSAGASHTCAILDSGDIKCWGNDAVGQLGDGGGYTAISAPSTTAIDLGMGRTAVAVSTGYSHTCAALDNGDMKCWGNDGHGQLGDGGPIMSNTKQASPVLVSGSNTWDSSTGLSSGSGGGMTNVTSAISCVATPSLPAGLNIDSSTCTISGTPTAEAVNATYEINATISGITYLASIWLSSSYLELTPSAEGADLYLDVPMTDITFQYNASAASGPGGSSGSGSNSGTYNGNGTAWMVENIGGTTSSFPEKLTAVGNTLFFRANNGQVGFELWKSNGTSSGTVMVKNINSGSGSQASSNPNYLTEMGNTLYFSAMDTTNNGHQLWKSDGTASGTVMVTAINSGGTANPGIHTDGFVIMNNNLFFSAEDGTNGVELWKSDGTASGTVMVKDINSGSGESFSYTPAISPVVFNNELYFQAKDGTSGLELWKSDGTASGTVMVQDIYSGTGSSGAHEFVLVGNTIYFTATEATNGYELWALDPANITGLSSGSGGGMTNVTVANCTVSPALPTGLSINSSTCTISGTPSVVTSNTTYTVTANISGTTYQGTVWLATMTFGTITSPVMGAELDLGEAMTPITLNYTSQAGDATVYNGNGTAWMVKDIFAGQAAYSQGSNPQYLTAVGDTLFFNARGTSGYELWKSDGTEAGTVMVKEIEPGNNMYNGGASYLTAVGDTLYFAADDGIHGLELWKSDGTEAGTVMVKDLWPGNDSSGSPNDGFKERMTAIGDIVYFAGNDGVNGYGLYKSDGTANGTEFITSPVYQMFDLVATNDTLYFQGSSTGQTADMALYKSDGTATGTVMLKNIACPSWTCRLTPAGDKLFFSNDDGSTGDELWISDGTVNGTVMVKDIAPIGGSNPFHTGTSVTPDPAVIGNTVFFMAYESNINGYELWKSDGTEAGTVLVSNMCCSAGSAPIVYGDSIFFSSEGLGIFRSDGTSSGTVLETNSVDPIHITGMGNSLYFSYANPDPELWAYNPTNLTLNTPPPVSWETYPALPAGMSISNGVISGTPTVYAVNQTYTIYANQSGETTTFDMYFSVDTNNPHTVVENQPIDAIGFQDPFQNGTTNWTVSPALPADLVMDPNTGEITGSVNGVLANTTYTVNATHSDGATETFTFSLQSLADFDGDGLANELPSDYDAAQGPTPGLVADTDDDADGLEDVVETGTSIYVDSNNTGSNPLDPDTDDDGICDGPNAVPPICIAGPDSIPNGDSGPPIWIGGDVISAVKSAAKLGCPWIIPPTMAFNDIAIRINAYEQTIKTLGNEKVKGQPLIRELAIGRTKQDAFEVARKPLLAKYESYATWGQTDTKKERTLSDTFEEFCRDRFIIGDEQEVVDEILKYKESFGVDNLLVRVQWPGLGQGEVLKTLDHLGKIIATVS